MSFLEISSSYKEDYAKRQELIYRICNFMQKHQELRLRHDQILKILRLFKSCWTNYSLPKTFSNQVLSYIADRMFCSGFTDSQYVVLLLQIMFRNSCHLSVLLSGTSGAIDSERHHEYAAYFLRHAYRKRALFYGYRMCCVELYKGGWQHPVQYAACSFDTNLLHVLLKYGALLSFDVNYEDKFAKRRPYSWNGLLLLLWILTSIVNMNPNLMCIDDLTLDLVDRKRYLNLVRCCKLMLPDLPRWPLTFLRNVYYKGKHLRRKDAAIGFIRKFSENVVPGLDRLFTAPLDLKQSCRATVRRMLNVRWLLPRAIDQLPIPTSVKQYLNLDS